MTTRVRQRLAITFMTFMASLMATSLAVSEADSGEAEINARLYEQW